MGTVRVNTDMFSFTVPAAEAGKAPEPRTAYRGEVIDLDAAQERRGRATMVTKHYTVGKTDIPAQEPALVDVSWDEAGAALDAAREARRAQLLAELDALGPATAVPTVEGPVPGGPPTIAGDSPGINLGEPGDPVPGPPAPPAPPAPPRPPAPPKR